MDALWNSVDLGDIRLDQRLAMAPMTRSRSTPEGVPTPLNAEYYAQRASMGLVISEGTQPSDDGQGYLLTPGVYTDAQIEGWRRIIDAVHAGGGRFVIQLMHVGRISHPSNTPHGRQPLGPSAVQPQAKMFTTAGLQAMPEPKEMTKADIAQAVDEFRRSAAAAIRAGADGVEIHGANGYLLHQFLSSNANQRTDEYGGSIDNRARLVVEVAQAVASEIGPGRTGLRISPGNPFNDIAEDDVEDLYLTLVRRLAPLGLAYLHVVHGGDDALVSKIREAWPGPLVINRARADLKARIADLESGLADVVSIGSMALANPDLVYRIKNNLPLNDPDPATFYGGDAHGYTDYPAHAA
jgi:N-ethylmaleimide reductase